MAKGTSEMKFTRSEEGKIDTKGGRLSSYSKADGESVIEEEGAMKASSDRMPGPLRRELKAVKPETKQGTIEGGGELLRKEAPKNQRTEVRLSKSSQGKGQKGKNKNGMCGTSQMAVTPRT